MIKVYFIFYYYISNYVCDCDIRCQSLWRTMHKLCINQRKYNCVHTYSVETSTTRYEMANLYRFKSLNGRRIYFLQLLRISKSKSIIIINDSHWLPKKLLSFSNGKLNFWKNGSLEELVKWLIGRIFQTAHGKGWNAKLKDKQRFAHEWWYLCKMILCMQSICVEYS